MVEFDKVGNVDVWANKEIFTYLCKNREAIVERLNGLKITRVTACDIKGLEFENWNFENELVMAVVPLGDAIDSTGKLTRENLKADGFRIKEKYYPIDIGSSEIFLDSRYIAYFPTRNLIVCKVNIFADEELYTLAINKFITNIVGSDYKAMRILSAEDKLNVILRQQWMLNIDDRKKNIEHEIRDWTQNHESLKAQLTENARLILVKQHELRDIDVIKKDFSGHIDRNIAELKALPIIKKIEIKDRIYLNFGKIYITGKVRTGVEKVDGVTKPVVEMKKVYIGELEFTISGQNVTVKNLDNRMCSCEHPHAQDGHICFGASDGEAHSLLANIELAKLAKLLYSWAISYNEGDAYSHLQDWYNLELTKKGMTEPEEADEEDSSEDEEETEYDVNGE